ncbi:MAG: glycoside hydrolase family 2 TIM barrel-domain containing protein, partial [Candidatus Omnitrophica bacterium]|nr:glycoside hydrolase family 2 TIM barrel-domain containing protein [Candidatus Omnitrophota bacterium]
MKKFNVTIIALSVLLINLSFIIPLTYAQEKKAPRIDIVGNSIYLDGKKFLIKGVGYSPFRPGIWPGGRVAPDIIEADFKRIKEAGFNTIRVWGTMPEDQLNLAEKYDLKVIQAAGVSPNAKFDYEGFLRQAESQVRQMAKISKNHPNVIMYLVTNEPHSQAILSCGIDKTIDMYKKLIAIVKQEDPSRPVSMANAYWTLWLDQSMWDVICFNVYNYDPPLVEDMGYANFVKNLRDLYAREKPLVVTEFGLSVSPDGPGKGGYGGNTPNEQADGVIKDLHGIIQGGAAGGCVFEWNDEWWKGSNAAVHDTHPEEWFGIVGIESKENPLGTPRKAYHVLKEEFKMIVTRPTEGFRMFNNADIEVNTASNIRNVRYSIDEGQQSDLTKDADWWRGAIIGESLAPGLHT